MKIADKLRAYWSREEKDLMFYHPMGVDTKADARLLHKVFSDSFLRDLTERGYDVTTLKFEISPQKGNQAFASQRKE